MRRLYSVVGQLVGAFVALFLLTGVWIVFDGLNDRDGSVDVALVTGHVHTTSSGSDPLLDRVLELYKDNKFHSVIVIEPKWRQIGVDDETEILKYLEAHGMPSSAIFADDHGESTEEMAHQVAAIMKSHDFESVMIVSEYYNMTRLKLALNHDDIREVLKMHVGTVQKEDVIRIGSEVVALYDYVGTAYLLPEFDQIKSEAMAGMGNASTDAEQAKQKVDKGLDSLAK